MTLEAERNPPPDLIVAALVFVVVGAGLRLAAGADPLRNAVLIGAALGVGALAKSFMVPWSVVYLVVLAAATVTPLESSITCA